MIENGICGIYLKEYFLCGAISQLDPFFVDYVYSVRQVIDIVLCT
jgi:hypothetical protein